MTQQHHNGDPTRAITMEAADFDKLTAQRRPVAAPRAPAVAKRPGPEPGQTPSRVDEGWRTGRPVEDPEKMKTWGYISAKPSEFLVHMRNGQVLEKSSGQGATCFKWPRDSVAIVPTSLQRLKFLADQVTLEKVGVAIVGLAVFRIADPTLAFRVLNFSYPERAQEKLNATLTDMLVGATRRLVANLSVDECLQKRKDALATELLQEVAPVVGGEGRPSDSTDRGWGVVLDTIEIQEVRVQSNTIFAQMQAPYRTALQRKADIARAAFEKETRLRKATDQQEVDAAELERARALDIAQALAATEKSDRAKAIALLDVQNKSEVDRRKLKESAILEGNRRAVERDAAAESLENARALAVRRAESSRQGEVEQQTHLRQLEEAKLKAQADAMRKRAERERELEMMKEASQREVELERIRKRSELAEREAELAANIAARDAERDLEQLERERALHLKWLEVEETKAQEQKAQDALAKARLTADIERDALVAAASHAEKLRAVEVLRQRAEIAKEEASARAQIILAEKLPELASAVGQKFGEIKLTQIGGGESGLNLAPAVGAFGEVLTLAKSLLAAPAVPNDGGAQSSSKEQRPASNRDGEE